MNKIFENSNLKGKIIAADSFILFSDLKNREFPSPDSERGKEEIAVGEEYLTKEFPILNASAYMRFLDDGDRSEYEALYFERRSALCALVSAECIEKKGRFLSKLMDIIWAILEETTWVVPAHNISINRQSNSNLPDCYREPIWYIDLFSAETGALIALAYYFLGDKIIKAGGQLICDRILYETERRIIKPFLASVPLPWMGYNGTFVNNWNPWIISNILTVTAITVKEHEIRKAAAEKSAECLDNFISSYAPDGGCNEGPSYWGAAGGALFDAMEMLNDMTGRKAGFFSNDFLRRIMEFILKVHICDNYFITFGDSHARTFVDGAMCRRMGRSFGSDALEAFGQEMLDKFGVVRSCHHQTRYFKNLLDTQKSDKAYSVSSFAELPDMQLCAMREKNTPGSGFYLWIKGGNNGESHNHNDVGSIGIYLNGKPLFIDLGIGTYTRFTFSDLRYTLFPIRTCDHTLPLIGGKGQHDGIGYKTDFFEIDKKALTVRTGIGSAYENRDIINEFTRTVSLKDGVIQLCDCISLADKEDIEFNFYLMNKPEKLSEGLVSVGGGAAMQYDPGLIMTTEEVIFDDKKLAKDWETDRVCKLSLKTPCKVSLADIKFIIKRI
ncbi:MAG: heparinase II/III family protein [Clostridia bacterium]|nr:heparinase II/III family protein [Clostridia bacterium]